MPRGIKRKIEDEPSEAIEERKCPICGKTFIPAPYHIYRRGSKWFCIWSCMLKYDREQEEKNKEKQRRKKQNGKKL